MATPCEIFAPLYQHMLEGSQYINGPNSLNYIFNTYALKTHNSLEIQSAADLLRRKCND